MTWDQWLILLTGPTAVGMSQMRGEIQRYACFVGLIGNIGWWYATWIAEQWGMFAAVFVYAGMWGIGLWNYWLVPYWRRT